MNILASHADVLRLATRSSGGERVTSLRTSAWEAIDISNWFNLSVSLIPFLYHFHLIVNKTKSVVLLTEPKHLAPTETEKKISYRRRLLLKETFYLTAVNVGDLSQSLHCSHLSKVGYTSYVLEENI